MTAARAYGEALNPISMQKKAIEACGDGDLGACISAPIAIPYTTLLAVVGVPLVFPIFLMTAPHCPQGPGTTSSVEADPE